MGPAASNDDTPNGDQIADPRAATFERLVEAHAGRLYAYCRRRTATVQDAEEVVAETLLIAWRRIDAVPAEPLPWLLTTAANVMANCRRGDRRRDAFLAKAVASERKRALTDPADEVATRFAVLQILDQLPPTEREALILTAWDGLDVREAAAVAGCSRAAFSVRLHRARRRVMKGLDATGHSSGERPNAGRIEMGEAR